MKILNLTLFVLFCSFSFITKSQHSSMMLDLEDQVIQHDYKIIQFDDLPSTSTRAELTKKGISFLEYQHNKTYLVAINPNFPQQEFHKYNILKISDISLTDKIHPNLQERPLKEHAVSGNSVEVIIQYYKNLNQKAVLEQCTKHRIKIKSFNGHNNFISAFIPIDKIEEIAKLNFIAYLSIAPEPGRIEDNNGRAMHRANILTADYLGGRNYDGTGIKIQVRDDGILGPHIDYHGRLLGDLTQDIGGDHSDGVAGIFTGAGNLNPRFRGMATGAELYNTDYQADFLDETLELHIEENVLVTNSSYSDGCNAGYTNITKIVDQQLFENPTYMHVFSAGNSNNNDCGYGAGNQWGNITGGHKQGKNVIATANLNTEGNLVNSSSRGPAYDGRIKPDIAAHGRGQISTGSDNSYIEFGGTSAAAPGIAGIFTMLHSAYQQLNDSETAEAALLKTCLLNTADDMGNQGPDFKYGWGRVNALRAVKVLEENRYLNDTIDNGETNQHTIEIPDGVVQAKVMIYWAEQDASTNANKALINNIDATLSNTDGEVFYPWILDPSPNPSTLNDPATTGIDDLNNMEQVALFNPAPGDYTFHVAGTEIPLGPVKYYVVYEFIYNELEIIYPTGGEALVPGESENIHWDAPGNSNESFTLSYSEDNGSTWTEIGTAASDKRQLNWTVPNILSGQYLVKVEQNSGEDVSDFNFSVSSIPQNILPTKVCPTFMTLEWDSLSHATNYDVFLLGEKYMDSIATSNVNTITIPIDNPLEDIWYAVRARGNDGLVGLRSNAQLYNQSLLDCPLDIDAFMTQINTNIPDFITVCESYINTIEIQVNNNGLTDLTDLDVSYQLDNETIITETISSLSVGDNLTFEFDQELIVNTAGEHILKVWTSYPGDNFLLNDTLTRQFQLSQLIPGSNIGTDLSQDFQSNEFPPQNWFVQNPDGLTTWEQASVTGSDGNLTQCASINNWAYNTDYAEDNILSIAFNIDTTWAVPSLSFDLAYTYYSDNYYDAFRVEISNCDGSINDVVYYKEYMDLATTAQTFDQFQPNSASDWRKEIIDLSVYAGEDVFVKFVNISGYGNLLYLDNINLFDNLAPQAIFTVPADSICVDETLIFNSGEESVGELSWNFGNGASPSTAVGSGPHEVLFTQAGDNTIILTANNPAGEVTHTEILTVSDKPQANFEYEIIGTTINFNNTTSNATIFNWDFGVSAATSNEENPSFTYDQLGAYTVQLIAENSNCQPDTISILIDMTVGTSSIDKSYSASIAPNPTDGEFMLLLEGTQAENIHLSIFDFTGKLILEEILQLDNGNLNHPLSLKDYSAGIYLLKLQSEKGNKILRVILE